MDWAEVMKDQMPYIFKKQETMHKKFAMKQNEIDHLLLKNHKEVLNMQ